MARGLHHSTHGIHDLRAGLNGHFARADHRKVESRLGRSDLNGRQERGSGIREVR